MINSFNLRKCLDSGQIVPFFQPIVRLKTGHLSGFEVLARWQHPVHGLVPPDRFIPVAEDAGFINELTNKMLLLAAESAAGWSNHITLSLNVSPLELHDRSLPQRLKKVAEVAGFSLSRLTVEITEGALIGNLNLARPIVEDLKNLGIRLALDDLGTGYSSLLHLEALPFDEVKIDACFVRQLSQRRESRKIAAAMVGLGLSLGLTTVAEGIEEKAQAEILAHLGCDCGQGWLFGHPVTAAEVPKHIARLCPSSQSGDSMEEFASHLETMPCERLAELRAIYDGAPVGLCYLDRDLRYVKLNGYLAEIHNLPLEAHLGRTLPEVLPKIAPLLDSQLRRALAGEVIANFEVRIGKKNTEKVLSLSCQPVRDESGNVVGISLAALDITERRRLEKMLK